MRRTLPLLLALLAACSAEPPYPWTIVVEADGTLVDPRGGERRVLVDERERKALLYEFAQRMEKAPFNREAGTGPLLPDEELLVRCAADAPARVVSRVLEQCMLRGITISRARLELPSGESFEVVLPKDVGQTHCWPADTLHLFSLRGADGAATGLTLGFGERERAFHEPEPERPRLELALETDDLTELVAATPEGDAGACLLVGEDARVGALVALLAEAERQGREWVLVPVSELP